MNRGVMGMPKNRAYGECNGQISMPTAMSTAHRIGLQFPPRDAPNASLAPAYLAANVTPNVAPLEK